MTTETTQGPAIRSPAGGGRAARNAYRVLGDYAAAATAPSADRVNGIDGETSEDVAWLAVVHDNTGAKVNGRTFTVTFGRIVPVEHNRKPLTPEVVVEDVITTTATRPDLTYLQPSLHDRLFAYVSNVGTVNVGGGEVIRIMFKNTTRMS